MWYEGLTKEEREIESIFHPEDWVGEYVKVVTTYKWDHPDPFTEQVEYMKLNKYLNSVPNNGFHYYEGLGVGSAVYAYGISCNICISSNWDRYKQVEITPISREKFIEGCKSILPENLKEFINFDKV